MVEQQKKTPVHSGTDSRKQTQLEGIRQKVFMDRYSLKDASGQPLEFYPEQLWARVARGIAAIEPTEEQRAYWEKRFYEALDNFQFVPGGRILAGAGSGHQVTFYNCYVIPSPEDSRQGILDNLKTMTEIMARGGGVGINLSTLRPRGSYIKTVNGTASGPFMEAVKNDEDWHLVWNGEIKKTIRARELWDLICKSAWESAEPGVVFMDRYNKLSNTWYYEDIRCVNPCVTGDTLIYTDKGLLTARDLAEQGTPVTVVSQIGETVTMRQATRVFSTGVKPVYRLQTTEGYAVRLTKDHRVLTGRGWKEAGELVPGEKIVLLNGEGGFGTSGSEDLGRVLGWLIGDGYINTRREGAITLSFFGSEQAIASHFAEAVNRLVAAAEVNQRSREYPVGVQKIEGRNESRVESTRLMHLIDPELLENKLQVPPSVLRGSHDIQKGFLSALFTADGSVQGTQEKGFSVRLTSISEHLLEGVQRLLLNFGIAARIYKNRREPAVRELPDGNGGRAAYNTQAYHDLVI